MGQEQKDLLLKDLCARLPYGVKVQFSYIVTSPAILKGIDKNLIECDIAVCEIEDVKPYLFPLSSMTLEQRCKVQNLLPNHCSISFMSQEIIFYDEGIIQLEQLEKLFNFFNMHHLDYRGLIPMGLASDATGLNIY